MKLISILLLRKLVGLLSFIFPKASLPFQFIHCRWSYCCHWSKKGWNFPKVCSPLVPYMTALCKWLVSYGSYDLQLPLDCRYLQWLIEDQDSCDAQFHTLYALSLAKSTVETFEVESTSQDPDDGRLEETKISDFGRNSIFQSPVRERLQIFLQSSDLYDPEEVLDLIEESELWLEKVFGSPFSHCFLFYLFDHYWRPPF